MKKLLLLLPLFTLCLGAVGCDPPTDDTIDHKFVDIVRDRAAVEFPCGWEHIAVAPLKGWAYRAEGCGMVQIYECEIDTAKFDSDTDKVLYTCRAESSSPMKTMTPATPTCTDPDGG
jgi:hypothetical protein